MLHRNVFFVFHIPALQLYEKGSCKWVQGNRKKTRSRKCDLEGGEKVRSMQGRREE